MKKPVMQFLSGLVSLALLTIFNVSSQAQNLVTNPGFETGDTTGWFAFGSPTISVETSQVHSGTYAAQVSNRTQTYMGIAQSFQGVLQAGQTYDVSAWVRLVSGGNQTMQLTMQKTDGSGTSYAAIASGSVSSSGWTQLSGQYTYNPSGTVSALNWYAEVTSSSNTSYYIDDVQLSGGTIVTNPPINGVSAVDWNNVHQRIDGFGASSAWNGSWNAAEADLLFSTNNNISYQSGIYNGVGLSLLRNRIAYANTTSASDTPTTVETSIMQMAQARGARVWSAPWTPAAGFKSTNDIYDTDMATGDGINGGSFLGGDATNQAYASQLANYVASMKANYNVDIYAISIQNEPDANVTSYEACQWSGAQIHDFVTNLYNALAAKGVGLDQNHASRKPELDRSAQSGRAGNERSQRGCTRGNYRRIIITFPIIRQETKRFRRRFLLMEKRCGRRKSRCCPAANSSIANGVYYARRIYQFMTSAQANAYHYWWLVPSGSEGWSGYQALGPLNGCSPFGQYSRFVRPNFYRIDATSSQPSALISAYKDTNSAAFAIVVVNTNAATDVIQTFNLNNFTAAAVTPWITSATLSLAPQTPVNVTNSSFTYTVPAMSVVTFVGQGVAGQVNTPPTIGAVPNQTANAGVTLLVTNTASDSDVPAQTLTFSPANTFPANATLNSSNGIFSWRPLVSQANKTNVIQIQVTDSGSPPLSATNSFEVIVNAVTNPVIGSVSFSSGQFSLTVNGPQGPDYTLLTSTNLMDWQTLFTTNSPVTPFTFIDTNLTDPTRFYRFQIGP